MRRKTLCGAAAAILLALALAVSPLRAPAASGYIYTYSYAGPGFTQGSAGNVSIVVAVPALLAPSTTYTGLPPGTTTGTMKVTSKVAAGNFSLVISSFYVRTDAGGNIASWVIQADSNNLTTTTPKTGTDHQISSIDTLSTTVPVPKPGQSHLATDSGYITSYYKSCAGEAGCLVASGQPYVPVFAGAVTIPASAASAAGKWTLVKTSSGTGCGGKGGSGSGGAISPCVIPGS